MKDMLFAILGLIAAVLCAGSFYFYVSGTNFVYFVLAIIFLILTLVFGGLFLSGKLNKTEDIHITE